MEIAMKITLGEDWKDLFDIIVNDSKKPLFQRAESAFYTVD